MAARKKTDDIIEQTATEQAVSDNKTAKSEETIVLSAAEYNNLMARIAALEKKNEQVMTAALPAATRRAQAKAAEKTVKLRLPVGRTPAEKRPLFVGSNGKCMFIPRGVEVEVPEGIANAYYDSEKQALEASIAIDEMSAKSETF